MAATSKPKSHQWWWCENFGGNLPKTNSFAPENRPSEKETVVFQASIFGCENVMLVSGRVSGDVRWVKNWCIDFAHPRSTRKTLERSQTWLISNGKTWFFVSNKTIRFEFFGDKYIIYIYIYTHVHTNLTLAFFTGYNKIHIYATCQDQQLPVTAKIVYPQLEVRELVNRVSSFPSFWG